jgi:hypothetical protein
MSDKLDKVIAYHEATKHHYHAYAPGPGMLDWPARNCYRSTNIRLLMARPTNWR